MENPDDEPFIPIELRPRHDGFTPDRQVAFLDALAESGCVEDACRSTGVSRSGAYAFRNRYEARRFRCAWDAALDVGIQRLRDCAVSRAINGVARPIFFQGKQVGERRYYDERLTQFLLRTRDPANFARPKGRTDNLNHEDVAPRLYHFCRLEAVQAESEEMVKIDLEQHQAERPNRRQRRAQKAKSTPT
jgi:hypothetical protein